MIGTETALWKKLAQAKEQLPRGDGYSLTRIETDTALGVSDVEYRTKRFHGWIELKTTSVKRPDSKLILHCPYTLAQYRWLSDHQNTLFYLRSWLLIGRTGPRTWQEWIMIPPEPSVKLLSVRVAPTLRSVLDAESTIRCKDATEVLRQLNKEAS